MLVAISGGPGAGKTTLLVELERRGFRCSPEVARQIIQQQVQAGGVALPWRDRTKYCRLMLERSVASYLDQAWDAEQHGAMETVFFDRGIPDALCYSRLAGLGLGEGRFWRHAGSIRGAMRTLMKWRRRGRRFNVTDSERWQELR